MKDMSEENPLGNYEIRKLFAVKRAVFGRFGHITGRRASAAQLEESLISNGLATSENVGAVVSYLQSGRPVTYEIGGLAMELLKHRDGTYTMKKHDFFKDLSRAMGDIVDRDGPLLSEAQGKRLERKWFQSSGDSA